MCISGGLRCPSTGVMTIKTGGLSKLWRDFFSSVEIEMRLKQSAPNISTISP
jgi:hypothetical protein